MKPFQAFADNGDTASMLISTIYPQSKPLHQTLSASSKTLPNVTPRCQEMSASNISSKLI